jgi:excisionase family DNA binding protein
MKVMAKRMLLKDAAEALGVSRHFLYTEARAGRIPHFRAGNRYIFDVEQVNEFLKQKALENVRDDENEKIINYGKLRKIEA